MKIQPAITLVSSFLALSLGIYAVSSLTDKNANTQTSENSSDSQILALQNKVNHLNEIVSQLQKTQATGISSVSIAEFARLKELVKGLKSSQDRSAASRNAMDSVDSVSQINQLNTQLTPAELNAKMFEQKGNVDQFIAKVDQSFRAEMPDVKWSDDTVQSIKSAFGSSELSDASLIGLECRTSLCKLEVAFSDPQKMQESQRWIAYKLGDSLPKFITAPAQAGSDSTVYYLSRKGYDLPEG